MKTIDTLLDAIKQNDIILDKILIHDKTGHDIDITVSHKISSVSIILDAATRSGYSITSVVMSRTPSLIIINYSLSRWTWIRTVMLQMSKLR